MFNMDEFTGMSACDVHEIMQLRQPDVIVTVDRFLYCWQADAEYFGVDWREGTPPA